MNKKILIPAVSIMAVIAVGIFAFLSARNTAEIASDPEPIQTENVILAEDSGNNSGGLQAMFGQMGFQLPTERFPAPDFTAKDLQGNKVQLSDYKGRALVFNLWATWCPPCREEMPSMETLYSKYKKDGFVILAASSSLSNDTFEKVKAYADKNKFSFPVLFDDEESIDYSYFTGSIPTSYIIDKEGIIVARIIGGIDWSTPQMDAAIKELLR